MINLFYNKKLKIKAKNYQFFPLLQKLEEKNSSLSHYFSFVDKLEDCDMGIIPMNIQLLILQNMKKEVMDFIDQCRKFGKKVLIFSGGDFGISIFSEGIYTIRLGGFHGKLSSTTYIMPPFIDDPYDKLNIKFNTILKSEKPTIGFVGHSNGSVLKFIKEYFLYVKGTINRIFRKDVTDYQFFYPSSIKRHKYLKKLSKIKGIKSDFIFRNHYRAGIKKKGNIETTTREFYQNMNQNLYTFCLRGTGNFSARFYETLAMGRIPVIIDTDCRLPFFEIINWEEHCIIISEKEGHTLGNRIIDFHNNTSQEDLINIQFKNRKIWKNYLRKTSYFIKLANCLKY